MLSRFLSKKTVIFSLLILVTVFSIQAFSSTAQDNHHNSADETELVDDNHNESPAPSHIIDEHAGGPEENSLHDEHHSHDSLEGHNEHDGGHHADFSPLLFIILALIIGAATRFFLSKIGLPFTVVLMLLGLGIGVLGRTEFFEHIQLFGNTFEIHILDNAIDWAANIDAHIMLYVFLPILIFEAAFAMDVHTFKKSFVNSVLLAVPGILIAIAATGVMIWYLISTGFGLQDWGIEIILLFGAVISATDPVAVVAILKELGASKKLGTLIEGESLLNDGTAIVIFMVILLGITGEGIDGSPFVEFIKVAFGGVLIGLVVGQIGLTWMKRVFNDMLVEITVIVALSYITFFLCEYTFGVSGVLGLVALGLLMAGPGRTKISPEVQHFIHEFWEFAGFAANTLIFLIVGVVIAERTEFDMNDIMILLLIYVIIHIARMIVIALLYPIMKRIGYGLGKNHPQAMWWGALRGAIGLALALIVESTEAIPENVRQEFLFLTAGIVTMTLLINATTMKMVANKLGLTAVSDDKKYVMENAQEFVHQNTVSDIEPMKKDRFFKRVNWDAVNNYLPEQSKLAEFTGKHNYQQESRRRILEKEKSSYWSQFKNGLISSSAYNILVSEINEIIDSGGERKRSERGDLDELLSTKTSLSKFGILTDLFANRYINKLGASFDAAKGFYSAQLECYKMIKTIQESATETELEVLNKMEYEIEENKIQALTFLRNFKNQFPNIYRHVSTRQAIRTLLNTEKKNVQELEKAGRITSEEAAIMITDIEGRMKRLGRERMSKQERHLLTAKEHDLSH